MMRYLCFLVGIVRVPAAHIGLDTCQARAGEVSKIEWATGEITKSGRNFTKFA